MFFNSKKLLVIVTSAVMLLSCALPAYAQTNNTAAQTDVFFTGTEENPVSDGTWNYDAKADTWTYTSSKQFKNTWAYITNPWNDNKPSWFRFDENGKMLAGWQKIYWNGSYKYFYFHEAKDGKIGELLVSGITPDGYTVDENGVWTVDGVAQEYYYQTSGSGSSGPKTIKEETKTIGEVLPDDFPTSKDDAWRTENGSLCFKGEDTKGVMCIFFHYEDSYVKTTMTYPLTNTLVQSGENYVAYYRPYDDITFYISGGQLEKIKFLAYSGEEQEFDGVYFPPQNNEEESLTIRDILPKDFPFTEFIVLGAPDGAWEAEDKDFVCFSGNTDSKVPNLCFETRSRGEISCVPFDTVVKKSGENYVCEHDRGNQKITFYMSEGKLEYIEHSGTIGGSTFLLSYKPPKNNEEETKTIGEVLPDDFPTSKDDAWRTDNGSLCFKGEDEGVMCICFHYEDSYVKTTMTLPLTDTVVQSGENYVAHYRPYDDITFCISEGQLEKIKFLAYSDKEQYFDGIYFPPQNNDEESLTIADIIPDDFPASTDGELERIELNTSTDEGGVYTPQNKNRTKQGGFVIPEIDTDKEYNPHVYPKKDDPGFTPSFKDNQSRENEWNNVEKNTRETLENALKEFKRSTAGESVLSEIRKREHYEKPISKRKKKPEAARKRKY